VYSVYINVLFLLPALHAYLNAFTVIWLILLFFLSATSEFDVASILSLFVYCCTVFL
jgi:hypothetical protein